MGRMRSTTTPLRHHRLELVVDQVDGVDLFLHVAVDDLPRQSRTWSKLELIQQCPTMMVAVTSFSGAAGPASAPRRLRGRIVASSWSCFSTNFASGIAAAEQVPRLAADGIDVDLLCRRAR